MSDDEKISQNMLILIFVICIILLVAVSGALVYTSPKTIAPVFSEAEIVPENSEVSSSDSTLISDEKNENIFPIEINTATSEELQLIPDIGPSTAQLIIDYRNEYGTIVTFRELLDINGIGKKTVEVLEKYCIIN